MPAARGIICLLSIVSVLKAADQLRIALDLPPGSQPLSERPGLTITGRDGLSYELLATATVRETLLRAGYAPRLLDNSCRPTDYPSLAAIEARLAAIAASGPEIVRQYDIGTSVEGRPLRVLRLTDHPDDDEFEPEFKYVAAMHGDEALAMEMALRLAEHLVAAYGSDPLITSLVDETEIHILPLLNPDGYVRQQRVNANGFDLNRNFPNPFASQTIQPETQAIIDWTAAHNFVLSSGLHSGALGIVYPWGHAHDYNDPVMQFPETSLMRDLCSTYVVENPTMYGKNTGGWEHGIINGAAWFAINGEMPDWNYRYHGCLETTIEFDACYAPPYDDLDDFWSGAAHRNREAMLAYLAQVHRGVRGHVTAGDRGAPTAARLAPGRLTATRVCLELPGLDAGWNLVSLPLTPDDARPGSIFPGAAVWEFASLPQRYRVPQQLEVGHGYWVFCTSPLPARDIVGMIPESYAPTFPAGWHLAGPVHRLPAPDQAVGYALQTLPDGRLTYRPVVVGEPLQPGAAYWFLTTEPTTLVLGEAVSNPAYATLTDRDGSGAFFRLLAPGVHDLWFADDRQAELAHTPPADASLPLSLAVDVVVPLTPRQLLSVPVPDGTDAAGLPSHTELTVSLPARAAACTLVYSVDSGPEIRRSATVAEAACSWVLTDLPAAATLAYAFELVDLDSDTILTRLPASGSFVVVLPDGRRAAAAADHNAPQSVPLPGWRRIDSVLTSGKFMPRN